MFLNAEMKMIIVTLVEGPNDASLTYANSDVSVTVGAACTFSGDQAICSAVADGTTVTESETISRIVVQAVTTGIPSASGTTPSSSHTTSESSSAASPTHSDNSNSGSSIHRYASYAAVLGGLVGMFMGY